jgi:3-deoxy-manno-octulosonate cytidylyltransferase (CMP-KDO synthetase)
VSYFRSVTFCIIIPARYASSRFPGKPLADIGGKTMIERVWDCAASCENNSGIAVATDDLRIASVVDNFGRAVMTSAAHHSGTDRCAEAFDKSGFDADIIVNIQGDEPFIRKEQVLALVSMFEDPQVQIATLKKEITEPSEIDNPNIVKVVCSAQGKALYFSRSRIPFQRESDASVHYFRHIGMYAYRREVLKSITQLQPSMLEECEKLEQLRWLENGYHIAVAKTDWQSPAVDTPEDLEAARQFLLK